MIEPSRIMNKIKLHLLTHAPADTRWFGPLIGESTKLYECYNGVFRQCSIFSNHQAPSRDIAIQLAGMESLKHRITGGYWLDSNGDWIQAGKAVRLTFLRQPILQGHIGWVTSDDRSPGV